MLTHDWRGKKMKNSLRTLSPILIKQRKTIHIKTLTVRTFVPNRAIKKTI